MTLELVAVSLSFLHKILLLRKDRRIAWIIGILASVISIFYFYNISLFVYAGSEIGFGLMMLYAFLDIKNQKIRDLTNLLTGIFCLFLAYLTFTGALTVLELVSSITALLGIYYLAHRKEKIGWWLSIVTCVITLGVVFSNGQNVFSFYMFFSLLLAIYGLKKNSHHEAKP